MTELLLADDDRVIRERLSALFSGEGYEVRTARDGEDAVRKFDARRPDLVLLDVMMPKMNGFAACAEIRKRDKTVPVLFLTAFPSEVNEVRGLDVGADDFMSKDASESVVFARIRRALGRPKPVLSSDRTLLLGSVRVDLSSLEVRDAKGDVVLLTRTEADILSLLASDRGRFFTTDEIITSLRGAGFACEDAMVYVHVSNIRRKLGSSGDLLSSLRNAGYRLLR